MKLIYRPAAAADIERAYTWYERERQGLGEDLLEEIRATVQLVLAMPEDTRWSTAKLAEPSCTGFPTVSTIEFLAM